MSNSCIIYDFNKTPNLSKWTVIDDVVMGGKSAGNFCLSTEKTGIYSGDVSLENGGGFSSLKYVFEEKDITAFKKIKIELKGDGKKYQFRIKTNTKDKFAYITVFNTTKEWQTIEVLFSEMYPVFKGRKLEMDNLNATKITQIGFLIANKKVENFSLEIKKIYLE